MYPNLESAMTLVETLIARAIEKTGSGSELARMLGVPRSKITQWKNGHAKCQPDDLAAIGAIAGYNALNVLAAATLEATEGTKKGAVLDAALGKAMKATGYENSGGLTPPKSLKDHLIQCILCKVDPVRQRQVNERWQRIDKIKKRSSLTK